MKKGIIKSIAAALSFCMIGGAAGYTFPGADDMALTADASYANFGACGENVTWTLDYDGTLTISGSGDMQNFMYNPQTERYPLFYYFSSDITSVIVENGVTSIGDYAFCMCKGITSVSLPDSVKRIGQSAFDSCSLKTVVIPASVTSIEKNAFSCVGPLESMTILSPRCNINDDRSTICNGPNPLTGERIMLGDIIGYEGSTAQAYASKYNCGFVSLGEPPASLFMGDANYDTMIDGRDATIVLSIYADASSGGYVPTDEERIACDVNSDTLIDGRDATIILSYYADISAGSVISFEEYLKSNNYI